MMNFHNSKRNRIFAAVIVVVLCLSMLLSLVITVAI